MIFRFYVFLVVVQSPDDVCCAQGHSPVYCLKPTLNVYSLVDITQCLPLCPLYRNISLTAHLELGTGLKLTLV